MKALNDIIFGTIIMAAASTALTVGTAYNADACTGEIKLNNAGRKAAMSYFNTLDSQTKNQVENAASTVYNCENNQFYFVNGDNITYAMSPQFQDNDDSIRRFEAFMDAAKEDVKSHPSDKSRLTRALYSDLLNERSRIAPNAQELNMSGKVEPEVDVITQALAQQYNLKFDVTTNNFVYHYTFNGPMYTVTNNYTTNTTIINGTQINIRNVEHYITFPPVPDGMELIIAGEGKETIFKFKKSE